jgi:adhesin transport system outer membrane protein
MKRNLKLALIVANLLTVCWAETSLADDDAGLSTIVQNAITSNPEVLQSYHSYLSVVKDKDAAFGHYLPSVDLTTSIGREDRNDPLTRANPASIKDSYTRNQTSISLRQMIFDGFATRSEVERLDWTSKAKLFELESTSQAIAFDATRAYIDYVRSKTLTTLAEDNYVAHKVIYEQLKQKASAGVGKKSDVEQAQSRLSLADYNMTMEGSNLHDVESRFQKVTGQIPPRVVGEIEPINKEIPENVTEALQVAQNKNPQLIASILDINAQNAAVSNRQSPFMPRVDFRAHSDHGNDLNGYSGNWRNDVAEINVSWNLFNGMTDKNLRSKEQELLEAATNRRDKTCKDIRLELQIAFNDIKKLKDQANYLDARQVSIEKARDAYRKQFEIGQRTLVDLLNAENEVFEAKRLYVNVVNDLSIAYAKTNFQMGTLLSALGVSRYASTEAPLNADSVGYSSSACTTEAPDEYKPNHEELNKRAEEYLTLPKRN